MIFITDFWILLGNVHLLDHETHSYSNFFQICEKLFELINRYFCVEKTFSYSNVVNLRF